MRSLRTAAVAVAAVFLSGCVSSATPPLPPPPEVPVAPTSSSIPDFSGTSLLPVQGTTTTAPVQVRGGAAAVQGRVLAGSGPAAGAIVRLERLVGEGVAAIDVVANAEGGYSAGELQGGRYRIRAFRPPDAAMRTAQTFFLGSTEQRTVDLALEGAAGGLEVTSSVAPDPPVIGELANFAIALSTKGVDSSGVLRSIPSPGVPVVLTSEGGRAITTPNASVTDASGRAFWQIRCLADENQTMTLFLPDGSSRTLRVSTCREPAPATTVTPPA